MAKRQRILVVSYSRIEQDARVLRQISVVARHAHVTTIGYGRRPAGADAHLELRPGALSLPQTLPGVIALAMRRFARAQFMVPGYKAGVELLDDQRWDAVVANDARALPLAFAAAKGGRPPGTPPAPIWADLHEWAPEERTHITSWRLLVSPYIDFLCREYLPRVQAATTVGPRIAQLYEQVYGVPTRLVRNAPPFADLQPQPVPGLESGPAGKIRLVHSGGAVPGRNIEATIDAALALRDTHTLDLFLIPAADGGKYLASLQARAQGASNIRFNDAVKPAELPGVLNQFDVGVFWIPPIHANARLTLPNKFFDYVQGRLAIAIGPTVEMVDLLQAWDLGVVAKSFDTADCIASLQAFTRERIWQCKQNAHRAASQENFEAEAKTISAIVDELLQG